MSIIGRELCDFSLTAYQKDEFKTVTRDDLRGRWSILFFYPADFTFVCPTELVDMQEHYERFKREGCEIYSVSTDSHFVHKAWHDHSERISKLKFPMLADPTHALTRSLDLLIEADGMAERGSVIISPELKVCALEISAGGVGRNAAELLRKLSACKFVAEHGDKVCPANWQSGDETLSPSLDLVGKL